MPSKTNPPGTQAGTETPSAEPDQVYPLRLQRFLARSGVASRRGSEDLMTAGRVSVNGRVVTELGTKVDPRTDVVCVDGREVIFGNEAVTLMLHKPAGYLTTMSDPYGRPCVAELVPTERFPGLFPVGRLDSDTTGLLLFSTDGNLGHELLRPRSHVEKRYYAIVQGRVKQANITRLCEGVPLEDGLTLPAQVCIKQGKKRQRIIEHMMAAREGLTLPSSYTLLDITIHEGRNRQIKRMCAHVGHPVVALHRYAFGGLDLGTLSEGSWCELSGEQLKRMRA